MEAALAALGCGLAVATVAAPAPPVPGYTELSGDCPGNNIAILRPPKVATVGECAGACNATKGCAGFSWSPVGDGVSKTICVPKSQACTGPVPTHGWSFYARNGAVPAVTTNQMFAVKPCRADAAYTPQAWAVRSPGVWPPGSFNSSQPNVIHVAARASSSEGGGGGDDDDDNAPMCLNADGGLPGWAARVWPCATSHNAQYWGDPLAQISSSVWRHDAASGLLTVRVATSTRGTPGGTACLRAGIPDTTGDWWFTDAVSTWFCNASDPRQQWDVAGSAAAPRLALRGSRSTSGSPGLCLEAVPRQPKPAPPSTPPGPADPECPKGCASAPCSGFKFCDRGASPQARAEDLVSRLAPSEKVLMLSSVQADPPKRFGLASSWMRFGEAQHGLCRGCTTLGGAKVCPTSFPSLPGIGASGNKSLFTAIGTAISDEARGWFNAVAPGSINLAFWAPNINLHRNLLWGRNQETPGESPTINGEYATRFIAAMQGGAQATDWGNASAPMLKTAPTIKHYVAYDVECTTGGPDSVEFSCPAPGVDRFHMKADVPACDFVEFYLAPFAQAFSEAKPSSIMCSFNTVNATPSCTSGLLMNTIARGEYGFDGFVVTDCGGIPFLQQGHYWAEGGPAAAVAGALRNGTDAECGIPGPWGEGYLYHERLNESLRRGLVDQATVDRAIVRKWRTAFRLGLFDPPDASPWAHLGKEQVGSPAHKNLTRSAAAQSMTLLKNDGNLLPIRPERYRKIAVIGPAQNITNGMQGPYSGSAAPITPPGAVLSEWLGESKLVWALGTHQNDTGQIPAAVEAVRADDVDLAVVFVQDTYVYEFVDRTDTRLQQGQRELITAVAAVGKPVVLVVFAGHTLALEEEKAASTAILLAYLPSEQGGYAVVDCLLGVSPPAGRLPFTMYPHSTTLERVPTDMSLRGGPGVTYLHFTGTPVWPFGFGMSYTSWAVSWSSAPPGAVGVDAAAAAPVRVSVTVRNVGSVASPLVVHGYVAAADRAAEHATLGVTPPVRELFDFARVDVAAGASAEVELALPPRVLASADASGVLAVRPGRYTLVVGGAPHLEGAATATLEVRGDAPRVLVSLPDLLQRPHER